MPRVARAKRDLSVEPPLATRHSRRLRNSVEPDASPLKSLPNTTRRKRTVKAQTSAQASRAKQTTGQENSEKQDLAKEDEEDHEISSQDTAPTTETTPPPNTENTDGVVLSKEEHEDLVDHVDDDNYIRQGDDSHSLAEPEATGSKSNRRSSAQSSSIIYTPLPPIEIHASSGTYQLIQEQVHDPLAVIAEEVEESGEIQAVSGTSAILNAPAAQQTEVAARKSSLASYNPYSISQSVRAVRLSIKPAPNVVNYFREPLSAHDAKFSFKHQQAMRTHAMRMSNHEAAELLIYQRIQILESEERAAYTAEMLRRKEKEIEKLRRELAAKGKNEAEQTPPTKINTRKRSAPVENQEESAVDERPAQRIRLSRTRWGGVSIREDPDEDNAMQRLLFHMPASPRTDSASSEDEEQNNNNNVGTQDMFTRAIEAERNALPNDPTSLKYQAWMKERFEKYERDQKREERRRALAETGAEVTDEEDSEKSGDDESQAGDPTITNAEGDVSYLSDQLISSVQQSYQTVPDVVAPSTTPTVVAQQPETPATNRWGIRSVFGSVRRYLPFARVGVPTEPVNAVAGLIAPATEPVRRITAPSAQLPSVDAPNHELESPTPAPAYSQTTAAHRQTDQHFTTHITPLSFAPPHIKSPQLRAPTGPVVPRRFASDRMKRMKEHEERRQRAEAQAREAKKAKEAAEKAKEAAEKARRDKADEEKAHLPGQKRKRVRVDDLKEIPSGPPGTFAMIDKYFEQDSEGSDYVSEDDTMEDAFTPPQPKRRRMEKSQDEDGDHEMTGVKNNTSSPLSSKSNSPQYSNARAHRYTGALFAESPSKGRTSEEGNLFQASTGPALKARPSALGSITNREAKPANWNYEGTFTVPDETDSESDSEGSQAEAPTLEHALDGSSANISQTTIDTRKPAREQNRAVIDDIFNKLKADQTAKANSQEGTQNEQQNQMTTLKENVPISQTEQHEQDSSPQTPARPSVSNVFPPVTPTQIGASQADESDALARARSQAEKYKPKTPSGLRAASKLSPSPVVTAQPESDDEATYETEAHIAGARTQWRTTGAQGGFTAAGIPGGVTAAGIPGGSIAAEVAGGSVQADAHGDDQVAAQQGEATANQAQGGVTAARVDGTLLPPKNSVEYAILMAKQVPVEKLNTSMFVFPPGKPPPGLPPPDLDVEVALINACEGPEFERMADLAWAGAWERYQAEKGRGLVV